MNRERAIEMIRKLLELAEGTPYEHESASALAKAEELLKRYGLAMEQCREKATSCTLRGHDSGFKRVPGWVSELFASIADVFVCCPIESREWKRSSWRTEAVFVFVGQPEDVELAGFMFEISYKVIRAHLTMCNVARSKKRDYALGVVFGVLRQIRAMRPECGGHGEGIVLHKNALIKDFVKERFNIRWDGMKYSDAEYDRRVVAAGMGAGQELRISMGLKREDGPETQALDAAPLELPEAI